MLVWVVFALVAHVVSASSVSSIPDALLFHRYELSKATCHDGSAPSVYWRNCSANWNRKKGDPDYCAPPSDPIRRYIIIFNPEPFFAYSPSSLASLPENRTSSKSNPATLFPDGVLSPLPEFNPNLYKSPAIFVPECTGDSWFGPGGRAIAEEVFSMAFSKFGLSSADAVTVIGGPSILTSITLPPHVPNPSLVCDGCFFLGSSLSPSSPRPCTTAYDCPILQALNKAWPSFNLPFPVSTLLPPSIAALATKQNALLVSQQADQAALTRLGAPSPPPPNLTLALALEATKAANTSYPTFSSSSSTPFSFGPRCSSPSTILLDQAFFHIKVTHTSPAAPIVLNDTLSQALPIFLETTTNRTKYGIFWDDPNMQNPTCNMA